MLATVRDVFKETSENRTAVSSANKLKWSLGETEVRLFI